MLSSLISGGSSANKDWYVQLGSNDITTSFTPLEDDPMISTSPEEGNTKIFASASCRQNVETPCLNLQQVLDNLQEGDTVYLIQESSDRDANQTVKIQAGVRKSFTLKTLKSKRPGELPHPPQLQDIPQLPCNPRPTTPAFPTDGFPLIPYQWEEHYDSVRDIDCNTARNFGIPCFPRFPRVKKSQNSPRAIHSHGIHRVKLEFSNNCSEHCSLTLSQSYFSYSSLLTDNLDIWIKKTIFRDSFITARSGTEIHGYANNIMIHDTEFKNVFPVKKSKTSNLINIEVLGNWNSVELMRSKLEGDKHSKISGIEVMHAAIQSLYLIDVQVFFFDTALVIGSSSVGIFNVTGSKFLRNRNGIDIEKGVRYMLVSRSEMNDTGIWSGGGHVHCHSALKGSPQHFKVEDSVFAHNRACGTNCKGTALHLMSNSDEIPLVPNYEILKKGEAMIKSIEVVESVFYNKAGIFSKSNVLSCYFLSLISRLQIRLDATPDCAF